MAEPSAAPIEQASVEEPASKTCVVSVNLQFEAEVVKLVNEARASEGLAKLSEHAILTQVARAHSTEMACAGFFNHDSPTGGPADVRVGAAGYKFSAVGENIAMGYQTPLEVVDAWLASEGHRQNLLGSDYTQIGIGFAQLDDEAQTRYWTIILASPATP
ncbi:MAG: CAP domain-containing protein [Anaerolineales bacterium]